MSENPFAPLPATAPVPTDPRAVFRDGHHVCTPVTATWPARCVRCNAEVPAADRRLDLTWTPRWVYLLILLGLLLALIAQVFVRRKVTLQVGFCAACAGRRRKLLGGWGAALGLALVGLCSGASGSSAIMAGSVILALVALGGLVVCHPLVTVDRVYGERAWIRAGAVFVASLPAGRAPPPAIDPLSLAGSRPQLDD